MVPVMMRVWVGLALDREETGVLSSAAARLQTLIVSVLTACWIVEGSGYKTLALNFTINEGRVYDEVKRGRRCGRRREEGEKRRRGSCHRDFCLARVVAASPSFGRRQPVKSG